MGRRVTAAVVGAISIAAATLLAAALLASPAGASFRTGAASSNEQNVTAAQRADWLGKAVSARARVIRVSLAWAAVAKRPPLNPSDPADLAYDFSPYDAQISDIVANGMTPLVTIAGAPSFAEGADRPSSAPAGTWKPDPAAYGAFAKAVATRYSGAYNGLPQVRLYEAWNEPNLPGYLSPQYEGGRIASADRYRSMLDDFYAGVKAADPGNRVIAGATAPFGDDSAAGFGRVRPLAFLRDLLCLKPNLRRASCPQKPAFDILSHHPIDFPGGPKHSAASPDDVSTPDMDRIATVLRAAERRQTIAGGHKRHPMWATELWWETNPPEPRATASPRLQARWIDQSFLELWKDGVKVAINLPLIDQARVEGGPFTQTLQSGIFYVDGKPKPGFEAFRFPFATERRSRSKLIAWGVSPRRGKLRIEKLGGGRARTVARRRVHAGQVFSARLRIRGRVTIRASVGGERSVAFRQRH